MILVPIVLVGLYIGWHIFRDRARVEASRQFARIDYRATRPARKR